VPNDDDDDDDDVSHGFGERGVESKIYVRNPKG
jgi:hypothetical protein